MVTFLPICHAVIGGVWDHGCKASSRIAARFVHRYLARKLSCELAVAQVADHARPGDRHDVAAQSINVSPMPMSSA
jgi:hypothetical protein